MQAGAGRADGAGVSAPSRRRQKAPRALADKHERDMPESGTGRPGSEHFEEAIARWQLHMQTEVKRVSALPTAMFDTCDPMLEATLASATERILASLINCGGPASTDIHPGTLHLERVSEAELRALLQRLLPGPPQPPDLGEGAPEELLSVLIDLCHSGERTAREQAARHLCKHLDVTPAELEQLTGELAQALERWLGDQGRGGEACRRVASNVAPLLAPKEREGT